MSYQEKKTIALMVSSIILIVAYGIFIFQKYEAGVIDMANDLRFWASTMLVFVGVGIVLTIVVLIIFHILNAIVNEATKQEQDDTTLEDEMDKLIELKASRATSIAFGIGFITSLIMLVIQKSPVIMLNTIFLSCFMGSFLESIVKLVYYRKGVKNV